MDTSKCVRFALLLSLAGFVQALTMDKEATNDAIAASHTLRDGENLALLLRGPVSKSSRREELMHVKGQNDVAVSLYYNKKSNKVTLESLHEGHLKSVSWGLGSHPKDTLILVVAPSRVKLVAGCTSLHWHPMLGRHDVLTLLRNEQMNLYREEDAPIQVYGNEKAALDSLNCDLPDENMRVPSLLTVTDEPESDAEDVKQFIEKNARRKRQEQMQGDDYRTNYIDANGVLPDPSNNRGDIPANVIESCDDEVIRQLQLLRQTIDHLRREVADQKGTIDSLRGQLRQCCRQQPSPPPVERCSGSSCYPGY